MEYKRRRCFLGSIFFKKSDLIASVNYKRDFHPLKLSARHASAASKTWTSPEGPMDALKRAILLDVADGAALEVVDADPARLAEVRQAVAGANA